MKLTLSIAAALAMSLLMVQGALANDFAAENIAAEHKALSGDLAKVASGIETGIKNNDVGVAKKLYELEVRTTKLLTAATRAKGYKSGHGKRDQISDLRGTMRQVLRLQERMLEHTLTELDKHLPGEPHRKLWARQGVDLYRPLFRAGTPQPGQPQPQSKDVLRDMQQDFTDKGGKKSQIRYLGPKTIEKFRDGQLVEWVQIGNRIRVTDAGAKHPVIALDRKKGVDNGKSVRGAGSMKIIRGDKGEIVMVVVSNSSGNYKPGIGSTIGLVSKLEKIGIPARRIAVTSVLPGEPVIVKLLMKSKKKYSKEQLKTHVKRLRTTVENRTNKRMSPKKALAKAGKQRAKKAKAPRARNTSRSRHQRASNARKQRAKRTAKVRAKARARAR
ncbi:MAG: hypothetical protein KJO07_13065 [Deltaproteobacteria bacterium]|nr:hypothetical protein [Deltaproteobacteria bacterium]